MLKKILIALGILEKEGEGKSSHKEMVPKVPVIENDRGLDIMIVEVAREFEDEIRFKAAAKNVAEKLEFNRAKKLVVYFHNNPPVPESLKSKLSKYGILGVWMNICQNSIFEILFNYKEQAIPTLYSIGFGVYDWTQYKAIDVLCRLASEGIQTKEIISDIGDELPDFRYEAIFPSIDSLAKIKNNEKVAEIIFRVFEEFSKDDPIDGLHILSALVANYPEKVKENLGFIKSIAKGERIENRSPLLDGAILSVNEKGEEKYLVEGKEIEGNFNETHRINAAILFSRIDSADQEINKLIDYWEVNAKDENNRKRVRDFKNK